MTPKTGCGVHVDRCQLRLGGHARQEGRQPRVQRRQQRGQHARGADAEPLRRRPALAEDLVREAQIQRRVLRRPQAPGGLEAAVAVLFRDHLQHGSRRSGGGVDRDLAGGGLDEIRAALQRQPRRLADQLGILQHEHNTTSDVDADIEEEQKIRNGEIEFPMAVGQ